MLLAKHEKELHSLRESHKLKLQAVHDHQQADMEEMEQRISELEGQCQRNELEQQQQQKNAEGVFSASWLSLLVCLMIVYRGTQSSIIEVFV